MFTKESALINRFTRGLTLFAEQLQLKNLIRYMDDNITAEQFVCELMNILYDSSYRSDNGENGLTPGYDLISEMTNEVIQVSRTANTTKIKDATKKLRDAIGDGRLQTNRYTLRFVFLVNNASRLKNTAAAKEAQNAPDFTFDPNRDILDFRCLAATVMNEFQFKPEKADKLLRFMDDCQSIFPRDSILSLAPESSPIGRVEEIIGEYARNFDEPLFMHLYSESPVTLRQLYVNPAFSHSRGVSRDMAGFLQQYLQNVSCQRERFLFVEGGAAIGKTSFVSWLCWHVQNQTETAKKILGSRRIVPVRLRELEFQGIRNAEMVLLKYLDLPDVKSLEDHYSGALLVLDGADELSMVRDIPHGDVEEFLLMLQRVFRSHKFLITTRTRFLDLEKFSSSIFQYRKIELEYYNKTMRNEWLERYLACGQTIPENTERFIRERWSRAGDGIADTPLALYLLAQCDAEEDLLGNPWALYRRIFSKAILKGEYNANFNRTGDLMNEHHGGVNYRVVQAIAFHIFRNASEERYYLNEREIMEAISECDLKDLAPERVRETCALCAYWKNTGSVGALEFYHNNIRDFFLCEYLCGKLLACLRESEPVEVLVPMLCRVLCYADICNSTWNQVYEYLCLRLDYESVQKRTEDSLYHLLQDKKKCLCWILPRVTAGRELWNSGNDSFVYRGAKQLFRNIFMLVRILQSFCQEKIELTPKSQGELSVHTMALLRNWGDMFQTPGIGYKGHDGKIHMIDAVSDTNYRNLDLSCQRIDKIQFQCCDMNGADFGSTYMHNSWFFSSVLSNILLNDARMVSGEFKETVGDGIQMHHTILNHIHFTHVRLRNISGMIHLSHCVFHFDTALNDVDLGASVFEDVDVKDTQIIQAAIRNTCFRNVLLRDSVIKKSRFPDTSFDGKIENTVFEDCRFIKSFFERPDTFRNVAFRNCRFVGISFRNMNLSTVTFENCKFEGCCFPQPPAL